ncbi:MAG: hypothetical protein KC444_03685 [Nitrosopumilus sp.]|nr:hypothetical protein [Nitrosopumilus sp.]
MACTCNRRVTFDVVDDIECDWGSHTVIQCPECEELFSVDRQCPAFRSVGDLLKVNRDLYSQEELSEYMSSSHTC